MRYFLDIVGILILLAHLGALLCLVTGVAMFVVETLKRRLRHDTH